MSNPPLLYAQMRCVVTSTYTGREGLHETLRLALEEEQGETPDGAATPLLRLLVSGDEVRRHVDGDSVDAEVPVSVVLPPEAIPALARGIEHLCITASKHQMALLKAATSALHAILPHLALDTVSGIARDLAGAHREGAVDGTSLLHTLITCELASPAPREAVAAVLLEALGVDTGGSGRC